MVASPTESETPVLPPTEPPMLSAVTRRNTLRRVVVTVCTIAIAAALGASAAHATAHWSTHDVQTAIRVADAHWPTSPCAGREVIQSVSEATLKADQAAEGRDGSFAAEAFQDGSCVVRIAWAFAVQNTPTPDYLCTDLEHEFGHLDGLPDTENDHDPMNWAVGDDSWIPWACAHAFPARAMCRYIPTSFVAITTRTAVTRLCARQLGLTR